MKFIFVVVLAAVCIIPSKCKDTGLPTKEHVHKIITMLRQNVADAKSKVDATKSSTGELISSLKQFAAVDEIENFTNVIWDKINKNIDYRLNKIFDDFTDLITSKIDGSEKILLPLKQCARNLVKNVDISVALKQYSECFIRPLNSFKEPIKNVINEIHNIGNLMHEIINGGKECLSKFNSITGFASGSVCLVELVAHTVEEAAKLGTSVTGTLAEAASFAVTVKLEVDSCIAINTKVIVKAYANAGVDAADCGTDVIRNNL